MAKHKFGLQLPSTDCRPCISTWSKSHQSGDCVRRCDSISSPFLRSPGNLPYIGYVWPKGCTGIGWSLHIRRASYVIFGKNGIFTADRTHCEILLTISGSCPQANPMPLSPIPCGQERFNSSASAPASSDLVANSTQSSSLKLAIIEAITTFVGKSLFSSLTQLSQYSALLNQAN